MALTPEELKNMIMLQRQVAWQFDLDSYTEDQIRLLRGSLFKAKTEIKGYLNSISPAEWTSERLDSVLAEIRGLSLAVEGEITDGLTEGFVTAGREALNAQNNMLSYGGRVAGFNFAGLGPGQLASMAISTPVGGQLLNTWVKDIFDNRMLGTLREEALAGLLKGESYAKFVKRFEGMFTNLSRSEIITLARSYIQAANVNAQKEVYRQNPELVPFVEWSAVLEPGYYKTGRGTCIRCAGLDGQIFTLDTAPPIPLHPRCRCVLLPKTPTYQELGLDIDEIQSSYRPYTIRPDKNIDEGGKRKILEVGFHDGDYSTWFNKRPASFQRNVLGPARYELLKSGKIKFNQFVNNVTGDLYTLKQLNSFSGPNPPSGFSPKAALKPKKKAPVLPKRKIQVPKTAGALNQYGILEDPTISGRYDFANYSLKNPPKEVLMAEAALKKRLDTPLDSLTYTSGAVRESRAAAVYSKSMDGMKLNVTALKKVRAGTAKDVLSYNDQLDRQKENLEGWKKFQAKAVTKADKKKARGAINRINTSIRRLERNIEQGLQAVPGNAFSYAKTKEAAIENIIVHELGHRVYDDFDQTGTGRFFRANQFVSEYSKTNEREYFSEIYSLVKMDLIDETVISQEAKDYFKQLIR
jgi:hypothetical protein